MTGRILASMVIALIGPGPGAAQDWTPAPALKQARLLIDQGRPQAAIEMLTAIPGLEIRALENFLPARAASRPDPKE